MGSSIQSRIMFLFFYLLALLNFSGFSAAAPIGLSARDHQINNEGFVLAPRQAKKPIPTAQQVSDAWTNVIHARPDAHVFYSRYDLGTAKTAGDFVKKNQASGLTWFQDLRSNAQLQEKWNLNTNGPQDAYAQSQGMAMHSKTKAYVFRGESATATSVWKVYERPILLAPGNGVTIYHMLPDAKTVNDYYATETTVDKYQYKDGYGPNGVKTTTSSSSEPGDSSCKRDGGSCGGTTSTETDGTTTPEEPTTEQPTNEDPTPKDPTTEDPTTENPQEPTTNDAQTPDPPESQVPDAPESQVPDAPESQVPDAPESQDPTGQDPTRTKPQPQRAPAPAPP